jgi:hypothetical protein
MPEKCYTNHLKEKTTAYAAVSTNSKPIGLESEGQFRGK